VGQGTVRDVSMGGWKVNTDQPVQRGHYFALRVLLPDSAVSMKVDLAAVGWSEGREFGVELITIWSQELARLCHYLSEPEANAGH